MDSPGCPFFMLVSLFVCVGGVEAPRRTERGYLLELQFPRGRNNDKETTFVHLSIEERDLETLCVRPK